MNYQSASIQHCDQVILEDVVKKCHFLFVAFQSSHQLSRWCTKTTTKDKSSRFCNFENRFFSNWKLLWSRSIQNVFLLVNSLLLSLLAVACALSLMAIGGVESNPGPTTDSEEVFWIRSQNCRGLTDRNKLFKIMKKMFPASPFKAAAASDCTVACLQETHCVDKFVLDHYFQGTAVIDDGDRNQRGVCTLISKDFEVCTSSISGVGRWIITVIRSKNPRFQHKYVIVNVYAPNCHRQAVNFFQDLFNSVDEVTESLVQQNENFDIAIVGDFNVVLDELSGASNRVGSNSEREVANQVKSAMSERHLMSPKDPGTGGFTWRRGTCLSKLDYIFLSTALLARSSPITIKWHEFGANFDHASVKVQIKASLNTQRGRSFPKLFKTDIGSETDRLWINYQIRQAEAQIPAHWDPHQILDFIKMILRSKTLELRQMKKQIENCESIKEEINELISKAPLNVEDANKVDHLKFRLHGLEEIESETLRVKAGVKWREEGEKSTSYFLSKFKARSEGATMHSLNLGTRLVHGSEAIMSVVTQFYRRLYNGADPEKVEDPTYLDAFFANCPMLSIEQRAIMARPLEISEIKESLASCNESAPGLDGIPYSFYKAFSEPLLRHVANSWNFAIQSGLLAKSHKSSCISLLPKKGKDLSLIGNWRPISLSSCDLKIITKAYANRLKVILPEILSSAQAAYIPGRDINFNNRLLKYASEYAKNQGRDHCVVSLDAQKAFDSVSHLYLIRVLEAYGFPPEFITVFRTLYADLSSVVQVNGFLSKEFKIRNGVKQGDALSCGLFVLAIDPLLRNLENNMHIEGLTLPVNSMEVEEIKILSYADDVTVVCRNAELQAIFTEYERFSLVSGLVLNADKTEVFNLIQSQNITSRVTYLAEQYELGRVDKIKVCGMWLTHVEEEEYSLNVTDKIRSMEDVILGWGRRHLTINGKMILAKTFLLSLVVFPAQMAKIRLKEIKRIEKLIYSFVNGSKNLYGPERIARMHLKAPKAAGGINGVDVDSFIRAIAVRQFAKAAKGHKKLSALQFSSEIPMDGVCMSARETLRQNYKRYAAEYAIPNLQQIESISSLPLPILLGPQTRANRVASQALLLSLGDLQQAFIANRLGRTRLNEIIRALPGPFSNLIRSRVLIHSPARTAWLSNNGIVMVDRVPTRTIRFDLLANKIPTSGVRIDRIYKRADWPPPGTDGTLEDTYSGIWAIKNPALRAVRLKVIYKDIFSNERRHRFGFADSPLCQLCGQIESVEHQMFSCQNSQRLWRLYHRITNQSINNLLEVVTCGKDSCQEIVKSVILKALIQIDRSKDKVDREIISQCLFFLRIEAIANSKQAVYLSQEARRIEALV